MSECVIKIVKSDEKTGHMSPSFPHTVVFKINVNVNIFISTLFVSKQLDVIKVACLR